VTRLTDGRCRRCYHASPHRVAVRAANLAARLDHPPRWLHDLATHLPATYHPGRACALLTGLGKLLTDGGPYHPQALLDRAVADSLWWARAFEEFLTSRRLAMPTGRHEQQATRRRQRRVDAVPEPLRPAAAAFADHLLTGRRRARTAGTQPRSHHTIDVRLDAVRDFARFLTDRRGKHDWATADVTDVEAFLRTRASKAQRLTGLRQFFTFAARRRIILIDPTRDLTTPQPFGFHGPTLTGERQRELFRRWSTDPTVHPHEAFIGLAALLHGATTTELCQLTVTAIDHEDRSIRLGRRPHPTPLDPWTWTALTTCLAHRHALPTANPHLLVTGRTKATQAPASAGYVKHTLDPAGIRPRILRSTRLTALATTVDPKLVATAYGLTNDAVTAYLADHVDHTRLGEPVKLQPSPRT
jgi:site-specific recombinase XerD